MLAFKGGVNISGLQPELVLAIVVAKDIWTKHSLDLTLTSGNDGKHMVNSLHYRGMAYDFRTKDIPTEALKDLIYNALQEVLEPLGFDIVFESRGGDQEHIHLEYDP